MWDQNWGLRSERKLRTQNRSKTMLHDVFGLNAMQWISTWWHSAAFAKRENSWAAQSSHVCYVTHHICIWEPKFPYTAHVALSQRSESADSMTKQFWSQFWSSCTHRSVKNIWCHHSTQILLKLCLEVSWALKELGRLTFPMAHGGKWLKNENLIYPRKSGAHQGGHAATRFLEGF